MKHSLMAGIHHLRVRPYVGGLLMMTVLSGCGGSDDDSLSASSASSSSSISSAQRVQAATATAQNNAACSAIQPFYWEVGDKAGALASASVGGNTPNANTTMLIASASKWMFGAYVVELRAGQLTADDIAALTMRTGYTHLNYSRCLTTATVGECSSAAHLLDAYSNDSLEPNYVGKFYYNGGHFQKYAASTLGLAGNINATLKTSIANQIGLDFSFAYDSPQLAAGISTSAADYAFFLRKILNNQLRMYSALGSNAVCTNPTVCPTAAVSTPIPTTESWHYSLGHWVEDDASVGDGAFSSPGAFGFYPWIDAGKTYYGIVARYAVPGLIGDSVAVDSVNCGRLIRKAWTSGAQQ
ncbi:MAG: hypothetical protein QM808_13980 [Steroidobacteraceae bacterium]